MSKVKPTTKEQLIYFLLQNISLGTYDKRFLTNLQQIQITHKNPVTSNQSLLLDKITLRYARQLRKKEIDAEEMIKLPWGVEPIESLPEYTDAFCTIKDDIVEIRSPYKKEFITDIKDTKIHLNWEKETKIWSAPLCELTMKHFIDCLDKHYQVVHYCPKTVEIINTMADLESASCWNPRYTKVNGNYLIAGISEPLANATQHLSLDLDPSTLARLTSYGIDVDQSVITDAVEELWNTDYAHRVIDFATTHNPVVSIDQISDLVQYLVDISCDYVVLYETFGNSTSKQLPLIKEMLDAKKIGYVSVDRKSTVEIDFANYTFPIVINLSIWGLNQTGTKNGSAKTVFLGNNKPIDIR